jgi:hypothetical protein
MVARPTADGGRAVTPGPRLPLDSREPDVQGERSSAPATGEVRRRPFLPEAVELLRRLRGRVSRSVVSGTHEGRLVWTLGLKTLRSL